MGILKLQDNLPMTGRLERVWYSPPKEYSAQLKLVGRWQEHTLAGVVDHGAGHIYVPIDLEGALRELGLVEVGTNSQTGEPTYKLLKPGPIQLLKSQEGRSKRTTLTLLGANGTPTPPPPATPPAHYAGPLAPAPGPSATAAPRAPEPPVDPEARKEQTAQEWARIGEEFEAALRLSARGFRRVLATETDKLNQEALALGARAILAAASSRRLTGFRGLSDQVAKQLTRPTA